MQQTESGLVVAKSIPTMWVKKHYAKERVVRLPDGRRARVWVDDSETVKQTETDDTLDAVVRPRSVKIQLLSKED